MELHVGQKATRTLTFTEESVKAYAAMTGDYNPLHFDRDFAAKTRFKNLVVRGGVTAGILNALVGMDKPGPGTVFMNQNLQYTAPVFIGDSITAEAEILEIHQTKPVTKLKMTVIRQTGEKVLEGECWCYTFRPEGENGAVA